MFLKQLKGTDTKMLIALFMNGKAKKQKYQWQITMQNMDKSWRVNKTLCSIKGGKNEIRVIMVKFKGQTTI